MVEHLTKKEVDDYTRQALGVEQLLSVSDHLGECKACRRRIEIAFNADAAFFGLLSELFDKAGAHLSQEEAARFVDRKLSGEELQEVADHLTICQQCAVAVDELKTFTEQIAPWLDRQYHPATVASPTQGWWKGAIAALGALFSATPRLAFGAALAVLLVAVSGWIIWPTQPQSEPNQEIADTPPPAQQPAQQPAAVVAQLKDGEGRLRLDQEGKLSGADQLPAAYQRMLKEALATGRIERSSKLEGLTRPPSSLMSTDNEGNEFSVIDPVGRVVMSNRPTFRWSRMEGARGYVVEVYDRNFDLVATSPQLTSRSWTGPRLPRGKEYVWQVKAVKEGEEIISPRPPAAQARFRILEEGKAKEVWKARRAYGRSHLMLGLLYAEAGLVREAEQELRALQKANPESEVARVLLNQVRTLRR